MSLDADGYPSDEDLETVERWQFDAPGSFEAFMSHVKSCWWMPEFGWHNDGRTYNLSTGGWSGNESVIDAMQENFTFWAICWVQSRRGGHFIFELPDHQKYFRSNDPRGARGEDE